MDFELRAAKQKLEREQKERKERARLKLEREKKARAEALRQREAIEASQRIRRLDAAEAQLKADQQMQESLLVGQGVMFYRILEAVTYQGNGDKIKLPPSCFTELSDQGALDKGPMYFKVSKIDQEDGEASENQLTHMSTHSGVLEFTAAEGSVQLPPHVWNNLFAGITQKAPLIEVRYVRLPKGTYAKLQPDEIGFSDLPNHKAILETSLRQHATLSEGDIVTVNHGERSYNLKVLELKPASSVSVLETDVEVDIVGPDSDSKSSNQPMLIPLILGKTELGCVEEGKYNYYKFSIESNIGSRITSGDINIGVKLDVDSNDGDTDIYVSRHPILFPTQNQHEWSSHDVGSKVLILNFRDPSQVSGIYSIGIYGFKGVTKYKILVALEENSNQIIGDQAVGSSSSAVDANVVECQNCKHHIPSRTIALHEAYCRRHNVVCQHDGCGVVLRKEEVHNHVHCTRCGRAFQQAEMEKHMKVFHEPLHCACGAMLEKEEMVQHQSSICPLRLITCRFCGDMVPAGNSASDARDRMRGLSEHESVCGSRTAPCDSCGRSVMLKEMEIHRVAVHPKN
ncbi:hypothetical protein H6P81_013761 [Aristolochia fimbriata]|uniref:Uncharacterized protein n=1 Tax=Aristolochia fimbriata TaxID=158543 RepID=A0AAV7EK94_ARIFI|nr:hypothetical protein H6P81_013761 [Aristolochia fimbriata]